MKDKVSELREILNKKKTMESKKEIPVDSPAEEQVSHESTQATDDEITETGKIDPIGDDQVSALQKQIAELKEAGNTQKEMFLRQAAEFENTKKRLQREQDEFKKYAQEKIIEELLPILDSLEMTLSHVKDESDPIGSGVSLILKQLLQTLDKFGVEIISGEGEVFDPNKQEAIGTEAVEGLASNHVAKVHRKGYALNGKLIRAAMVAVTP